MRDLGQSILDIPRSIAARLMRTVARSMRLQLALSAIGVVALVAGIVGILPSRTLPSEGPTLYGSAAPTATAPQAAENVTIDAPFILEFSKPMNEGSVADALEVSPKVGIRLIWDTSGKKLSVTPASAWEPFTNYSVKVSDKAMDQSGIQLGAPVSGTFMTGALTSARITATIMSGEQVSPNSSFQITFSRPVKLATVEARLMIDPPITGDIVGDDPTDAASQVFTFTPNPGLAGKTKYTISFDHQGAFDTSGVALLPVAPLTVDTSEAPNVVVFRPRDGSNTTDPNQVISVRFNMPMDRSSTAAAFSVTVNGRAVRGAIAWAEGDTVLVLDPSSKLPIGSNVTMKVTTKAMSKTGMHLKATVTGQFGVRKPTVRRIPWLGGTVTNSPWYASETYYWRLVNCTRTGGWVTSSGNCSSVTHHVMPDQPALRLDSGLSAVARNYSKQLAERGLLTHYLDGTNPHQRLVAAGYPSGTWGENLGSPPTYDANGMIKVEIFFQNEYRCDFGRRCEFGHYLNIMYPYFHRVGIGVWVARGHVRVTSEFYY
jgi:hypothetical protein